MLPERKREAEEASGSRRGFEVRVIGGGAPQSLESERTAASVQPGLVIGQRSARPRPQPSGEDEGPVHRLEVEEDGDLVKARSMSEVGPAVPRVSSRAKKKRQRLQQVTMWMAIGVCGITVIAVGGVMMLRRSDPAPQAAAAPAPVAEPLSPAQEEKAYFVANADALTKEAESTLRKYVETKSADEAIPFLRDRERVTAAVREKWRPWGSEPKFVPTQDFDISVGTDTARASVIVTGTKGDFTPFAMIFVRQDGKLVLDWEATQGIGDLQVPQLKRGAQAKDLTVRAEIGPSAYYTPDFPEEKYRCYKLTGDGAAEVAWGYVALDSPVASLLKSELSEDSFLLEGAEAIRATLRVSGPGRPGSDQYLITEMLHKGWVSP